MIKEEIPSVNPKLDSMCEMLKTIHTLNERNKMLEAQIEKMKSDVIECFGSEYNVLVAKLLNKWGIKEK